MSGRDRRHSPACPPPARPRVTSQDTPRPEVAIPGLGIITLLSAALTLRHALRRQNLSRIPIPRRTFPTVRGRRLRWQISESMAWRQLVSTLTLMNSARLCPPAAL